MAVLLSNCVLSAVINNIYNEFNSKTGVSLNKMGECFNFVLFGKIVAIAAADSRFSGKYHLQIGTIKGEQEPDVYDILYLMYRMEEKRWYHTTLNRTYELHKSFILGEVKVEELRCGNRFNGFRVLNQNYYEDMLLSEEKIKELDFFNEHL